MLRLTILLLLAAASFCSADHHEGDKQYIELRHYQIKSAEGTKQVDEYLVNALVPALNRAGSEAVGVLREEEEQDQPVRLVVIAHDSIDAFAKSAQTLAKDKTYQDKAADFLALDKKATPLVRIRSELLHSFDCWPALKVPAIAGQSGRMYELRIYESSTEHYGNLKVEMFNAGEVPIFIDSDIIPVFMGQAIVGENMPNLTYMTVYENQAAKDKGWDNFRKHPDWKVLSAKEKYKGTVSKIHKMNLVPVEGSQL